MKNKKQYILSILFLIPAILSAQTKKIFLLDKNHKPINNFQVQIFSKDKTHTIKNEKNNYFYLNEKFDSISINYNFFYNKKIKNIHFKKNDTIVLKQSVSLKTINLNNKNIELGIKDKLKKFWIDSELEYVIRLDVSKYKSSLLKYIQYYLNKEPRSIIGDYNKIELLLFSANDKNPDGNTVNLLKKPYIISIEHLRRKGWRKINLTDLEIELGDYNYLFVGFKVIGNRLYNAISQAKKYNKIESYSRIINHYDWQVIKWNKAPYKPAIKIGLKE